MARAHTGLAIVLTMRGIRSSKGRLENVLSIDERAELNRWLLARTLRVIERWSGSLDQCIFVTACSEAAEVAARRDARVIEEPGGALGHNHAAGVGAAHALKTGAQQIMLLPCDLPLLDRRALDALARLSSASNLVLAPDRHGSGTNALVVDAAAGIEFKFGDDSRALYTKWGRATGRSVLICKRRELAFDLDTPADLEAWKCERPPKRPELAVGQTL